MFAFHKVKFVLVTVLILFSFSSKSAVAQYLVNVKQFGAVADAKQVNGVWVGTDNSQAFNKCAAYCRKNGLTMFLPKGNYGVASTVWLTNPEKDGFKQSSLTAMGSNKGVYRGSSHSANICVLKGFEEGKEVEVQKANGKVQKEPYFVPVLGISNGRQVHIEGIGIQGNSKDEFICAVAIGNISQLTSFRFCSFYDTRAGIVFPGIREAPAKNVKEGNNDLLVVEQCTFDNAYDLVCGGTMPFACEYRSNRFQCTRSVFTGKLITNKYGHSRGSHKFSSCLFGSSKDAKGKDTVYFDLHINEITIDSCHFETGLERQIPEILIRQFAQGGAGTRTCRLSFTNNIVNFSDNMKHNPTKNRPLIEVLTGNRAIFQGNSFRIGQACRIKSKGGIFIGNVFNLLKAPNSHLVEGDVHQLVGEPNNVQPGKYSFNHFLAGEPNLRLRLPDGKVLQKGKDYKINKKENAFEITKAGKKKIDKAKTTRLTARYRANDAQGIHFRAWGRNRLNPPHGWTSSDLTFISNKVITRMETGAVVERSLKSFYEPWK